MTEVDRYSANSLRRALGKLNSITFKDDFGEMEYFGQRVLMLRTDLFRILKQELESRHASGTGKIILEILGRSEGQAEGKKLMSDVMLDTADHRSIPIFLKNAVEETNLGYGKLKLGDVDMSLKTLTVSTENSVEADGLAESNDNGCSFLLGYLEGLFSELLNSKLLGSEALCRGRGDKKCVFNITPGPPPSKWKL